MKYLIKKYSELLKGDKWVELRVIKSPKHKINGYTYSHEIRCNGNIVSVLPFKKIDNENNFNSFLFLSRVEATPCWEFDKPLISSLTGGVDPENTIKETVIKEIREESGFIVNESDLIDLGESYSIKSSDTTYHLYAVEVNKYTELKEMISESELENSSYCRWLTKDEVLESKDPFLTVLMTRLFKEKGIF